MKPDAQRGAGFLKDRPGQRVDVIPAALTGIRCAPGDAVVGM